MESTPRKGIHHLQPLPMLEVREGGFDKKLDIQKCQLQDQSALKFNRRYVFRQSASRSLRI